MAKDIRDRERGGRADIKVIEGEEEEKSSQNMEILTELLGERSITLTDGPPDEMTDQEQKANLVLYQ